MDTGSSSSSSSSSSASTASSSSASAAPGDAPGLDGTVVTVAELEARLRLAQEQLAQNTRRTFVWVPFSPEECASPENVLEDARKIIETTGLRKLAVDLYRADAKVKAQLGLPEPSPDFSKQALVDHFNQCPDKTKLLLHAAARVPILLQYPGPAGGTPPLLQHQPGQADRVFIIGHGHFRSAHISSHTVPLTMAQPDPGDDDWLTNSDDDWLTNSDDEWLPHNDEAERYEALPEPAHAPGIDISPQEIIARMRATGIPDQIGKINLLCCGGSTSLHPAFVQACKEAGAYPDVPVTAYGTQGVSSAIISYGNARTQLDLGLLSIIEADDLSDYQTLKLLVPSLVAGLEYLEDQLATAIEQQKKEHEKAGTAIPPLPSAYPIDDLSDSDDEDHSTTADIDELVADLHVQIQRTETSMQGQMERIAGHLQPASSQKVRDTIRLRPDGAGLGAPGLDLPQPAAAEAPLPVSDAAPDMPREAAPALDEAPVSPRLRDHLPHLDRSRSPNRTPAPTLPAAAPKPGFKPGG